MQAERVTTPAYDTCLEHVSRGHNFAAIQVVHNGLHSVFISGIDMPEEFGPDGSAEDAFAHALTNIQKARDEAERDGAHPV